MSRNPHSFEKRRRELDKKKKQDEKRQKRLEKKKKGERGDIADAPEAETAE